MVVVPTKEKQRTSIFHRRYCWKRESNARMIALFTNLQGLSDLQRAALLNRYVSVMNELRRRTKLYAIVYHVGRVIVTIGSLLVPALLSIQYTNAGPVFSTDMSYQIYWITWAVSLLVTTFNGILTLFRVEKKYYFLHTTMEQIKSETFQYIYLSGIYGGHYCKQGVVPSHANQYKYYVHHLEKIKLKQVEEEYYKAIEQAKHQSTTTAGSGAATNTTDQQVAEKTIAGLYTPTPSQNELVTHQQVLADAVLKQRLPVGVSLEHASNKTAQASILGAGGAAAAATATAAKQTQTKSQTKGWRPPSPTTSLSV